MLYESFPPLDAICGIRAAFTRRVPGLDICVERDKALAALSTSHLQAKAAAGLAGMTFATAEQVHGNHVAEVSAGSHFPVPETDALLTTAPNICLGIYVADCAAVFLADRSARGIALVHSGQKGTELGVASRAAKALCAAVGGAPSDLVLLLPHGKRTDWTHACDDGNPAGYILRIAPGFGLGHNCLFVPLVSYMSHKGSYIDQLRTR